MAVCSLCVGFSRTVALVVPAVFQNSKRRIYKMSGVNWWEEWPCPLHPSWGLSDISERDMKQLKLIVETDDPDINVVESAIYRAFLEYPRGRPFYNQGRRNPKKALEKLGVAKDCVKKKFRGNNSAKIGYGIVINSFTLSITMAFSKETDEKAESELKKLITEKDHNTDYKCYITVVQAYIYSRLGRPWQGRALSLYNSALERFPDNCEWLFGKALMLGREARQQGFRKGWKNKDVEIACLEEKTVLEKILKINPEFHSARALYGQVKFTLGEKGAETEIRTALEHKPERHNIVMVATRYYRRKKNFEFAGEILERFINSTKNVDADTYFQLGYLRCFQANTRGLSENQQSFLRREALNLFEKSVEINSCHYPALTVRAEVKAVLGETEEARELFEDLFDNIFKNKPYLAIEELMSLDRALGMRLPSNMQVFSTKTLVILSHRYIVLTAEIEAKIMKNREDCSNADKKITKHLEKMGEISSDKYESDSVRRLAKLKLADANRLLKRFREAKKLYEDLLKEEGTEDDKGEILWGLGKCYFNLELDKEGVMSIADELKIMNQQLLANDLHADVYLRSAKAKLEDQTLMSVSNTLLFKDVFQDLEYAIKMGSLEGSYVFINFACDLKKDFFTLDLRIPQIAARISLICSDNYKGKLVHTNFLLTADDRSSEIHDEMIKRCVIKEKLNELLKYEHYRDPKNPRNAKLLELEDIRRKRLVFEIDLIKRRENEKWNQSCAKSLKEVIQDLRELMDHVISFYKVDSVLKHSLGRSIFPVKFDRKENKVNKSLAQKKINIWIKETFPDYPGKLPDDVIQTILEVQPMYNSENTWLAAFNELNNKLKHHDLSYASEKFELRSEKPGSSSTWKSEDLVRKSCKEVERLVLYFLSKT
ncbi:hypothetical protein HOLleu_40907 [Holothuria leucospilota]|uniref:Uncharacterized protein n=1 Tax=Holothuria leucospilota TaxID=206669 RepID=A0A9Q0YE46_HOLLE|nr:hypothetical protein HOLleu_40907 [Holothuria leucospilota]